MAIKHKLSFFAIFAMVTMATATPYAYNGLSYNYYKDSCPNVTSIAKQITEGFVGSDPTLAAGLIRMDFHDAIVRGCDASVLLDSTPSGEETEKDAIPNSTLRGFEVINAIKDALELECPHTVSCADVLRLASRDAIVKIKGPYWRVPLGRKDGKISLKSEALKFIPSPFADFATLAKNFQNATLSIKDLVVLSGAHTIGRGHCFIIQDRLYNYNGQPGLTDPSIDPTYAATLKGECPQMVGINTTVPMDVFTHTTFDSKYFTTVSQHKGMFQSDAALLNNLYTKTYLEFQSLTGGATFNSDFAESMTRLINVGVLTGDQGEVRLTCGAVNSY